MEQIQEFCMEELWALHITLSLLFSLFKVSTKPSVYSISYAQTKRDNFKRQDRKSFEPYTVLLIQPVLPCYKVSTSKIFELY